MNQRLSAGDLVEIRPVHEIAKTLDANGAIDSLPFMAEMVEFCGKRFHVSRRALSACFTEPPGTFRGFNSDQFVMLDDVRCSGAAHDGCQKACIIFWHEQWLRKVTDGLIPARTNAKEVDRFRQQLTSNPSGETYRCQATDLLKATHPLSRQGRVAQYLSGWRHGNFNVLRMIHDVTTTVYWRIRQKVFGNIARGSHPKPTPTECLNLQAGDWVQVKPMSSILATLDRNGQNRGLHFSTDMRAWCGQKLRVKSRLDKIIIDETGQMRKLKNTVCLEGSTCGCAYMGLGKADCSRCEVTYWREIWLQRV